jgi:hypothetical protein
MLLRFWHAKSDQRRWASARLGNFAIIGTRHHAAATSDLYQYILNSKGLPQPGPLLRYLHRLLDVLVRTENPVEDHIACPTDQAACLTSLRPRGHFRPANSFTGWCAKLQHCMFDIAAQIVRLESRGHDDYVPLEIGEGGFSDHHEEDVLRKGNDDLHSHGASDADSGVDETSGSEHEQFDSTAHIGDNGEDSDASVDSSDGDSACDRGNDDRTREDNEGRMSDSA